jgi:hypothetical protein
MHKRALLSPVSGRRSVDPEIIDYPEKFAFALAFLGSSYLFLRIVLALFPA